MPLWDQLSHQRNGSKVNIFLEGLHDVTHASCLLWSLINEKAPSLTLLMPWLRNKDVLRSRSPLLANCPGFFLVPHWHEIYQIALVCIIRLQINIIIPQFETFCLENIFMSFNISCWQFTTAWKKTAILCDKHTQPLIQRAQNQLRSLTCVLSFSFSYVCVSLCVRYYMCMAHV